jgi:aminopeptidase N
LASIRALGTISTGQTPNKLEEILEALEELSGESFFLTQVAVVSALAQMETVKAIGVLRSLCDQTPDGRVRRRAEEAMQKVQKQVGSDKAIKQLREELDQIKQENQDLKSRLESLEAKSS